MDRGGGYDRYERGYDRRYANDRYFDRYDRGAGYPYSDRGGGYYSSRYDYPYEPYEHEHYGSAHHYAPYHNPRERRSPSMR